MGAVLLWYSPQPTGVATASGTVPQTPEGKIFLPLLSKAPTPTPTATPSLTRTSTPTVTMTNTSTYTPTDTQTPIPTSTPTVGPPLAPSNVSFTNVTTSSITVSYINNAPNASDILFENAVDGSPNFQQVYDLSPAPGVGNWTTPFFSLQSGTTYCFRLRAQNALGMSGYSNTPCVVTAGSKPTSTAVSTSTPTVGPPLAPSNVSFTNVTTSSITVNYTNNAPNAADILFEDAINGSPTFQQVYDLSPAPGVGTWATTFYSLQSGTTYCFRLRAQNALGVSAYSNTPCVVTAGSIPTPTWTPTPISGCNGSVQAVINPSFESGFSNWSALGYPLWINGVAIDGTHSMLLGGYNYANDLLAQFMVVPSWAETAAVYASWDMTSTDTPYYPTDALQIAIFDSGTNFLEDYFVWNTSPRGLWYYTRQPIPNIAAYRGTSISVALGAITDYSYPTGWYVDNVWVVFACGVTPANQIAPSEFSNAHLADAVLGSNPIQEQALRGRLQNTIRDPGSRPANSRR
jgi:hypothetical protein